MIPLELVLHVCIYEALNGSMIELEISQFFKEDHRFVNARCNQSARFIVVENRFERGYVPVDDVLLFRWVVERLSTLWIT